MQKYRFKEGAGRHIGIVDGKAKVLAPGDEVELTDNQAQKFADKFERRQTAEELAALAKQRAQEAEAEAKEAAAKAEADKKAAAEAAAAAKAGDKSKG